MGDAADDLEWQDYRDGVDRGRLERTPPPTAGEPLTEEFTLAVIPATMREIRQRCAEIGEYTIVGSDEAKLWLLLSEIDALRKANAVLAREVADQEFVLERWPPAEEIWQRERTELEAHLEQASRRLAEVEGYARDLEGNRRLQVKEIVKLEGQRDAAESRATAALALVEELIGIANHLNVMKGWEFSTEAVQETEAKVDRLREITESAKLARLRAEQEGT